MSCWTTPGLLIPSMSVMVEAVFRHLAWCRGRCNAGAFWSRQRVCSHRNMAIACTVSKIYIIVVNSLALQKSSWRTYNLLMRYTTWIHVNAIAICCTYRYLPNDRFHPHCFHIFLEFCAACHHWNFEAYISYQYRSCHTNAINCLYRFSCWESIDLSNNMALEKRWSPMENAVLNRSWDLPKGKSIFNYTYLATRIPRRTWLVGRNILLQFYNSTVST